MIIETPARSSADFRIYAACLASYNNGVLHGAWIDVDGKDADDIQQEINLMLKASGILSQVRIQPFRILSQLLTLIQTMK